MAEIPIESGRVRRMVKKIMRGSGKSEEGEPEEKSTEKKIPYPKIALIDLDDAVVRTLEDEGFNIISGSLGTKIRVNNDSYGSDSSHPIHLNCEIPINLHENQIVVINLVKGDIIDYKPEEHCLDGHQGQTYSCILSQYPEMVCNPRPAAARIVLRDHISRIFSKEAVLIVFADSYEKTKYKTLKVYSASESNISHLDVWTYDFFKDFPYCFENNRVGQEFKIEEGTKLTSLLKQCLNEPSTYTTTFAHPLITVEGKKTCDPGFIPLVRNSHGDIVSFAQRYSNGRCLFVFPQVGDKQTLLLELLKTLLPGIIPSLFPFQTEFQWLNRPEYYLPNFKELLESSDRLDDEYEGRKREIENAIVENKERYLCLHQLITATDKPLVKSIENYLRWLGFEQIRNMDETEPELLEEDIQVDLPNGKLLVIEIKGISGTSTDTDCGQVFKYKNRRADERGTLDVYGLYIANHQKHLPPLDRERTPFNETQIDDAIRDKRGLLTTWQLFCLYKYIKIGFISKEEARDSLIQ